MEFLTQYGLFLAKTVTIVIAIASIIAIAASSTKQKSTSGKIDITDLSKKFQQQQQRFQKTVLPEHLQKNFSKQQKQQQKQQQKAEAKQSEQELKPRTFVINFKGSTDAKEVDALREEVNSILLIATPKDEVVIQLFSPGGVVYGYGLVASQLARFKQHDIPLVAIVDQIAASGGYMAACVANKIIAAPFAMIGSIGVIAQLPNFNKLLKKNHIDYEQITAGEFKRTLTIFGENTEQGREKFREEIDEIHQLFKQHVLTHREQLDIDKVATGEVWFGEQALTLGLIDEIGTSDEYLLSAFKERQLFKVEYQVKKNLSDKIGLGIQSVIQRVLKLPHHY